MFRLKNLKIRKGASALPVILLVSGIILEVVVAGLVVSQLFSNSLFSEQLGTEALEAARSGAQDAVSRVMGYVNCPDAVYCPSTYTVMVGSNSACVNIGSISEGIMVIYSKGSVLTREKTIEATLGVEVSESKVTVHSFKEIENPDSFIDC